MAESRRWDGAKPVSLEVENLKVAQSPKCVRSDALNMITTDIDVLKSLIGMERVDAEKHQLIIRESQHLFQDSQTRYVLSK